MFPYSKSRVCVNRRVFAKAAIGHCCADFERRAVKTFGEGLRLVRGGSLSVDVVPLRAQKLPFAGNRDCSESGRSTLSVLNAPRRALQAHFAERPKLHQFDGVHPLPFRNSLR